MLAYADETPSGSVIVIGAGVPAEWLKSPLQVRGLLLRQGPLDWRWDGRQVEVEVRGVFPGDFRLGPAFPPGTPVEVERDAAPASTAGR
jgi:hypothetical protein